MADASKNEIVVFNFEGELLHRFGSSGTGPGQLQAPLDVVLQRDTLVVRDAGNSRFQLFDLQGHVHDIWRDAGKGTPVAFAFDGVGNLYYTDLDSGGLQAIDAQGKILARADVDRSVAPRRTFPNFMCVTADPNGDILVLRPNFDVELVKLVNDGTSRR